MTFQEVLHTTETPTPLAHASPSVRRFARELGVDLTNVCGSGQKGRITQEDVKGYIKSTQPNAVTSPAATHFHEEKANTTATPHGFHLPPLPVIDFADFGPIQIQPLSRIQRISGPALHRNALSIPHITQFDEADITDLESFRQTVAVAAANETKPRLTLIAFIMKAVVAALQRYPQFNASLDAGGEHLILKNYFHIGVAVDTPHGLVVPVIREVDRKGLWVLAEELATLSAKARAKKLLPDELRGGCFTVSSLGGIGGSHFTPIINAPEVAILGVGRATRKPVWQDNAFVPRLMLPLSLSYDHRVIDGAAGARFITHLSQLLGDIRRLLL